VVWTASGTPRAFPQVKKHYFTLGERREEFRMVWTVMSPQFGLKIEI
jgi:hypothetical protein